MPRSGGESDKFGNRYEGVWTVRQLLDVAERRVESIRVESGGGDGRGVEFVVHHTDGRREYHSVKRQRSGGDWTLYELTRSAPGSRRSVLGDLHDKLDDPDADCCFVSSTGANDLRELTERARQWESPTEFLEALDGSSRLRTEFERRLCDGDELADRVRAHDRLQRTRVELHDEVSLTAAVEQRIAYMVYRPDGGSMSDVRLLLADFVIDRLDRNISADDVWEFLAGKGFEPRDWSIEGGPRDAVRSANERFTRIARSDLVNGEVIPRQVTSELLDSVEEKGDARRVLVTAAAGVGKSCVLADVVETLAESGRPVLGIRLDRHGDARLPKDVGHELGLPQSPVVVLAGIANGGYSVLVVDQLDAASQTSGRYPFLWEVFDDLCNEASRYPNMRVIVACREFDLEHDRRLRKLKRKDDPLIAIGLLNPEEVDAAIASGVEDVSCVRLDKRQRELLQTPLHLFLFLSARDPEAEARFRGVVDLFHEFWRAKRWSVAERLGSDCDWEAVVDRLCDAMNGSRRLEASRLVVDDLSRTVDAMLTEHVLVADRRRLRFFHESFFDYAFARRFVARGQSLLGLLRSDEQHLFRRGPVRQILAFLREESPTNYLATLSELLSADDVRLHIKSRVIAWLGALPDPDNREWDILEGLLDDSDLKGRVLIATRNNLAWFDRLNELGVIERWNSADESELQTRSLWYAQLPVAWEKRSETVAGLISPHRGQSAEWDDKLRDLFRFHRPHHSAAMQHLFLDLLEDGLFDVGEDGQRVSVFDCLRDTVDDAPEFVLEALVRWFDRRISAFAEDDSEQVLGPREYDRTGALLVKGVASAAAREYLNAMLPRFVETTERFSVETEVGLQRDRIWCWWSNTDPMGVIEAIGDAVVSSLSALAKKDPDRAEALVKPLWDSDCLSQAHVLLRTAAANPDRFGDRCLRYLATDDRRLDVGYGAWSGDGTGQAAVSRDAISAILPHATPDAIGVLERAILQFSDPMDVGKHEGWTRHLLLQAMGEDYLSEVGRQELKRLRDRFPETPTETPRRRALGMRAVGSPVPDDEAARLSDDEWLEAMREYDFGWEDRPHRRPGSGSAVELSRVLETLVGKDRQRFAELVHRMEDSIHSAYFETILNGLCGAHGLSAEEKDEDEKRREALDTAVFLRVIDRLHRLPSRPCGRAICRAFETLAGRAIPAESFAVLAHYATDDLDPENDDWLKRTEENDRDPAADGHFRGYNSVRGAAAQAIASLLFEDFGRDEILRPIVEHMTSDPSLAVRTCVVDAILPIWNHDRGDAVRLFLRTLEGAEVVLGAHPCVEFLRRGVMTRYDALAPLLHRALTSSSESAVATASRIICLASFSDPNAETDAARVRCGSDVMRQSAAEVYAHNLDDESVTETCAEHLRTFFDDPTEEVRAAASACFLDLDGDDLNPYSELISDYVDSETFPARHDGLLRKLEDTRWSIPEVTLRLATRFLERHGPSAGDVATAAAADAPTIAKLVVRLYTQTEDETLQSRCLDLIDEMERQHFWGLDAELDKLDR